MPARVSRKLYDRNEKLLPTIRDIASKAQLRLCSLPAACRGPDGKGRAQIIASELLKANMRTGC